MAAGLSIAPENLLLFRERLNELVRLKIDPLALQRTIRLDAEVKLGQLNLQTINALEQLGPFGMGNPGVKCLVRNVRAVGEVRRMGDAQKHARFRVSDGSTHGEVVWWNAGELPPGAFDLAVTPQTNFYNGTTSVQLKLVDVRAAGK